MNRTARGIAFFVGTLALGEIVRRLFMSRIGKVATERLGRPELATYEGATAAASNAKKAVGFVRTLVDGRQATDLVKDVPAAAVSWAGTARDASEMLLAVGAVLKTVSDFAHEDSKLRNRFPKSATRG